ncbi:MAG: energy-coupling factor ABC transporter permease [Elusimicrobiota bacterium]|jgi:cobalt/nickel transport system permease protein|nr:energy-coupling factor ABC transporter permease [Elusimicrobiota bacterium]
MHIPDGFLNNGVASGFLAGAVAMLGFCLGKVLKAVSVISGVLAGNADGNSNIAFNGGSFSLSNGASSFFQKMCIAAIWVFAFQMFNLPIASATSAHLLGGVFAAILVGPFAGFIVISSVLIIQSFFFADGGVLALGANIFNMAFIGSLISYYIYKSLSHKSYYLAVTTACFFSILVSAFACVVELSISGTVSFGSALKDMMNLHLIFAVLETFITLILVKAFKSLTGGNNEK